MEGAGTITLTILKEGARAVVEVADTGKGIRKKDIGNVFKPGFTTKNAAGDWVCRSPNAL